jgi:hypothetical protein
LLRKGSDVVKFKIALAAAAMAAAAVPGSAQAAYLITGYAFVPGSSLTGTIQYTPTNLNLNVGIGRLNLTGTQTPGGAAASFLTYCIDIFHTLSVPATFDYAPLSTLLPDATKQARLFTLIGKSDLLLKTSSNKAETSAAVQLAAWEIVNENTASYGFSTGTFRSSGGNSGGARLLAQTYLDNITTGTWTAPTTGSLKLFYSANSQSQVIAGVPEPATWAMMLGGFGVLGAAARRRRAVRNVVTA